VALLVACVLAGAGVAHGAGYAYRGQLDDDGHPAIGTYALRLSVYDMASGGSLLAGPVEFPSVKVDNGAFHVDLDLPPALELRKTTWLQVDVAGSDHAYAPIGTRSAITAVTGVCWDVSGNSGTVAGTNFLGTLDNQPLELHVANRRTLRVEPRLDDTKYGDTPNVNAGSSGNKIGAVYGATVSGGGSTLDGSGLGCPTCGNAASGDFSTVAGGIGNSANAFATVIGGGEQNRANGYGASVGGGDHNSAGGASSTIGGGENNHTTVYGTVPGGIHNCAGGFFSLAAGYRAKVRQPLSSTDCGADPQNPGSYAGDKGTFVWSDSQDQDFVSNGEDEFLVRAGGGVGINSAPKSPSGELTVFGGDGNADITLFPKTGSNPASWANLGWGLVATTDDNFFITHTNQTDTFTARFRIDANGNTFNTTGTWSMLSDRRLKRDIDAIAHPLDTLLGLHGRTFEYIDPDAAMTRAGRRMGFIAQEVETVLPQWISEDARGYKLVTPQGFEALNVEALRELRSEKDAQIAELRAELDELQHRLAELRKARAH
jgi:hypothetical protein